MIKDPRCAHIEKDWLQALASYNQLADERGWGVLDPDCLAPDERAQYDAADQKLQAARASAESAFQKLDAEYGVDRHLRTKLPGGWEGDAPHDVMTLPHVASYLSRRLSFTRLNMRLRFGAGYEKDAIAQLDLAVRNAHRLFDFLRLKDRHPKPSGSFSDWRTAEGETAALLNWVQDRIRNGPLTLDDVRQRLESAWDAYQAMIEESTRLLDPLVHQDGEEIDWKTVAPYLEVKRAEFGVEVAVESDAFNERGLDAFNEMRTAAAAFNDAALDLAIAKAGALHQADKKVLMTVAGQMARAVRQEIRDHIIQTIADVIPLPGQRAMDLICVLEERGELPDGADMFARRLVGYSTPNTDIPLAKESDPAPAPPKTRGRPRSDAHAEEKKKEDLARPAYEANRGHPKVYEAVAAALRAAGHMVTASDAQKIMRRLKMRDKAVKDRKPPKRKKRKQ